MFTPIPQMQSEIDGIERNVININSRAQLKKIIIKSALISTKKTKDCIEHVSKLKEC